MSALLRIGLIGAGANTRERHLPGFRALADVEVMVVANRTAESAQRVAREFVIPRVAADWRAVVADPVLDAVCIGTWPYLHAEISCAALAAGKHVLTEARMARDAAEAAAMLAAARARPDLVAQVVPSPLTLGVDATIRRLLAGGQICTQPDPNFRVTNSGQGSRRGGGQLGALREIAVTHTTGIYADAAAPMTWRQDFALSGHNTLTLGILYEAVLRWTQEDVAVESATAEILTPRRARPDGSGAEVRIPERLTVHGRYAQGARLVMHLSGVERGPGRNEIRIEGEHGTLRLAVATQELGWTPRGGTETPVAIPVEERRAWRVEADFVDSIRTGAPVRLTDFATGVRTMQFTDAVWQAWSAPGV